MADLSSSTSSSPPTHTSSDETPASEDSTVRRARVPQVGEWLAPSPEPDLPWQMISIFRFNLFPFLQVNAAISAPTTNKEVAGKHQWIESLFGGNYSETDMVTAWKYKNPELMEVINLTFARIITQLYWQEIDSRARPRKRWEKSCPGIAKSVPASRATDWVKFGNKFSEELMTLQECFWRAQGNPMWEDLCSGVKDLCQKLGTPAADFADPSGGVRGIQDYYLYKEANRQYNTLLGQFEEQKKLATSLSFRYVIEHLAPSKTNNNTKAWRDFWNTAFEKAIPATGSACNKKYEIANLDKSHHLARVFEALPGTPPSVIKQHGHLMYNTLSANIHSFSGNALPDNGRWDVIPKAILEALTPEQPKYNEETKTEEIDWDAESEVLLMTEYMTWRGSILFFR
ncbi:hypothetical protein IFR05_000629 [Cadophora sp. M221]|nr:hypothetical protein IFR05_000629 [Cadophora sp. M221]